MNGSCVENMRQNVYVKSRHVACRLCWVQVNDYIPFLPLFSHQIWLVIWQNPQLNIKEEREYCPCSFLGLPMYSGMGQARGQGQPKKELRHFILSDRWPELYLKHSLIKYMGNGQTKKEPSHAQYNEWSLSPVAQSVRLKNEKGLRRFCFYFVFFFRPT